MIGSFLFARPPFHRLSFPKTPKDIHSSTATIDINIKLTSRINCNTKDSATNKGLNFVDLAHKKLDVILIAKNIMVVPRSAEHNAMAIKFARERLERHDCTSIMMHSTRSNSEKADSA